MIAEIGTDIIKAAEFLRRGEPVAIPTETVYGLAANALDQEAVKKVFAAKERPLGNPLIVHLHSVEQLSIYATEVPKIVRTLISRFSPGPLTYLLPKQKVISDLVTAGSSRAAFRFPDHALTRDLLQHLSFPLCAPSANKYTSISPTTAQHVFKQLGKDIPYILDGGPSLKGIESTVIAFENDQIVIYRPGSVTMEDLKSVYPNVIYRDDSNKIDSPGLHKLHYSPKTKLILTSDPESEIHKNNGKEIGLITFSKSSKEVPITNQFLLSENGDIEEAAGKLYAAMYLMDEQKFDVIIAEKFVDSGLGKALNDRLKRASGI